MECTIMPGCPLPLIIGSYAMAEFKMVDIKHERVVTMNRPGATISIKHMPENDWRQVNSEAVGAAQPLYSVNQLDQEKAHSDWLDGIKRPETHRLAVIASLLKACQMDKPRSGTSHIDLNDISFETIHALADKLKLTKETRQQMIAEVEAYTGLTDLTEDQ